MAGTGPTTATSPMHARRPRDTAARRRRTRGWLLIAASVWSWPSSALPRLGLRSVGYFSLDDYVFYTRAGTLVACTTLSFLFSDYNGHLMPGSMVWVWLTTDLAPLDFTPVVVGRPAPAGAVDVAMFWCFDACSGSGSRSWSRSRSSSSPR